MQNWEYLFLEAHIQPPSSQHVIRINGEILTDRPNLWEYLRKLGEEGWELVNAYGSSYGERNRDYFVFKRQKD